MAGYKPSHVSRARESAGYERDFQTAVIDAARLFGWRVAHFRPARTAHGWRTPVAADGAGFPDLVMLHPTHGLLVRELKADRGRLSDAQAEWLAAFEAIGVDAGVWRPDDWAEIEAPLRGVGLDPRCVLSPADECRWLASCRREGCWRAECENTGQPLQGIGPRAA